MSKQPEITVVHMPSTSNIELRQEIFNLKEKLKIAESGQKLWLNSYGAELDKNRELIELLLMALPYVEEGQQFNKKSQIGRDVNMIREALRKAGVK
jgi:hypothetical protein